MFFTKVKFSLLIVLLLFIGCQSKKTNKETEKNKKNLDSNYKTSIYINLIYLLLIIPGFIFMHNGLFCRYYFFSLLIFYIYFYKVLYEKVK